MKALLYTKPYSFEYTDVPDPVVGDDDVLIRVRASGICGSDVHGFTGETGRRIPHLIMGHEAAGTVERTGANVRGLEKGDRVCFDSTVYCNKCRACLQGKFNHCEKRQVLGVSVPQFKRHGTFAEYVAVPWWIVFKIPEDLSFVKAALLEPASIGTHAANRAPIQAGDTVVVIGAGTIGLFIMQGYKLKDAKVIAADINEFRLDLAKQLGADVVVNPLETDLKEAVLDQTDGSGADVVLDAVGYAKTFDTAVSLAKLGGCVVAVGNLEKKAEFDLQQFIARELTFTGSYASAGEFEKCIELIASGRINVEPLISEVLPLEQGQEAFDRLLKAEENLLKIVLEP